jgi:hypothetical protein
LRIEADRRGVSGGAAKACQTRGRREFDQQIGGAGRHADRMHHQRAVILQRQHGERCGVS